MSQQQQPHIPGVGIMQALPDGPRYAGFNRRMLAATIDSVLVMIFLAPVIDWALVMMYGEISVDLPNFMQQLSMENDPQKLMALFHQNIVASGLLRRWLENTFWQTAILASATGICWHFWSATPGKMLLGCKVLDAKTLGPMSFKQIIVRLLGYIVSTVFLFFGFFWIGFNKQHRGWHDCMANTLVIIRPKKTIMDDNFK